MKRNPRRRSATTSRTTSSTVRCRGFWPSVRHTEQKEQCFGQPRIVCTEPHMYLSAGSRSHRAERKAPPSMRPPSYNGSSVPCGEISQHLRPDDVAIALDDRVRGAVLARFVRVERGVNAAEDDRRATLAREAADLIAAQRVRGVDADADDIARFDLARSNDSSVSSTISGVPYCAGVAAART